MPRRIELRHQKAITYNENRFQRLATTYSRQTEEERQRKGRTGGEKRQRFMHGQSYRPDEPEESVMSRDILFHVHQHY